ncbi:TIGR00730 family Rossman fold protein [candidate division TA06 bacterium]|nr:TIGR00730 family Rossman fold protein [candidate division TA06 bacterium]
MGNQDLYETAKEPWRIFRIMAEFVEGFEELSQIGPAVTLLGSSRAEPEDPEYQKTERIAQLLVEEGYGVITGAGSGIMEAANKGAKKAKGESIGLNIQLPLQQKPNKYLTRLIEFRFFFTRRVMFLKYAKALVILPGGYGTLDEFFEAVTLFQTQKVHKLPILLVGKEYWGSLVEWMRRHLLEMGRISKEDLQLFTIVEEPGEVLEEIKKFYSSLERKRA